MLDKIITKIKSLSILFFLVSCGLFIYILFFPGKNNDTKKPTEYTTAQVIKEAKHVETETIPISKIKVYKKGDITKKIKLPERIAKDKDTQIVTASTIKPHDGNTSVVTTINTATGNSEVITKQDPLPLFGLKREIEIGLRYGYTTQGKETVLYGRYSPIRVGHVRVGVYGEVSTHKQAKAMIDFSYRF